jgi:hypothetical protein
LVNKYSRKKGGKGQILSVRHGKLTTTMNCIR